MKNENHTYDFIFCGFGLSAILLYLELRKQKDFKNNDILIIDLKKKQKNDKRWSFWSFQKNHSIIIPHHKWGNISVANNDSGKRTFHPKDLFYCSVKSADLYRYVMHYIEQDDNVRFVNDEIKELKPDKKKVVCNQKTYKGIKMIDSFFEPSQIQKISSEPFLWQHFLGYEVQTDTDVFDKKECMLMDFRVDDKKPCSFMYVLPYSSKSALVEYTLFDNDVMEEHSYKPYLEKYLKNNLNISNYKIANKELGQIPMSVVNLPQKNTPNLIQIGTKAGYVKPSTGYSFNNNLIFSQQLAKQLFNKQDISSIQVRTQSPIHRIMDLIMLEILQKKLIASDIFFMTLFKNNSLKRIVRFLTEKDSFFDRLMVMMSVKKKGVFIRLFIKYWVSGWYKTYTKE